MQTFGFKRPAAPKAPQAPSSKIQQPKQQAADNIQDFVTTTSLGSGEKVENRPFPVG